MSNTGEQPVTNAELKRQFKWQDLALVLAILGGFGSGYIHLIGSARAQADDSVGPLRIEVESISRRLARHEQDAGEVHAQLRIDMNELQRDIRALYKAVMTGQKQDRLEKPPVDAGQGN